VNFYGHYKIQNSELFQNFENAKNGHKETNQNYIHPISRRFTNFNDDFPGGIGF
jgi:hypothetical protein